MKIIVGLGNPGKRYAGTKHNVGFTVMDKICEHLNIELTKTDFEAQYNTIQYQGKKVFLVKPLTYMNDSGAAVGPLMHYYKMEPKDLLVIQDDMDLALGKVRFRDHGSSGGHNGIKSIIRVLRTETFDRLKVGIQHPKRSQVVDWVLTPFSKTDQPLMDAAFDKATSAAMGWLDDLYASQIMNRFNG